jgi:hypothetical protein
MAVTTRCVLFQGGELKAKATPITLKCPKANCTGQLEHVMTAVGDGVGVDPSYTLTTLSFLQCSSRRSHKYQYWTTSEGLEETSDNQFVWFRNRVGNKHPRYDFNQLPEYDPNVL